MVMKMMKLAALIKLMMYMNVMSVVQQKLMNVLFGFSFLDESFN